MHLPSRSVRRSSPIPIYVQIADILLEDILIRQIYAADNALPSESELIKRFNVSRVTVRKALQELEHKGIIYREKGRGSFVRQSRIRGISGFGSFTEEVARAGRTPGSTVLEFCPVELLPTEIKSHFHVEDDTGQFFLLKRLRLIDDKPVAVESAYLPSAAYPGLESIDFNTNNSLLRTVEDYWGIVAVWTEALIEAVSAPPDEAELLGVAVGAPLLVAWRVTLTETDDVIEYVRSVYVGRDFLFNIGRHRIR